MAFACATSASDTSTSVIFAGSPAGQVPLPVRHATSFFNASAADAQAGASNLVATSSVMNFWVSADNEFHLSRFIAVTTGSHPPSGMVIRWSDTSHQPALYPEPAPVTAQSITPRSSAPGTSENATFTPLAPSASRNLVVIRPEPRTFLPLRSVIEVTAPAQKTTCGGYGAMARTLELKRVSKISSTIGRAASTMACASAAVFATSGTSRPSSSGASPTA